jgi:HAMP domain-containing protein
MKWNSIRTKVLAAMAACLILGVGGILTLLHYSFARNSRDMALESVTGSQKLFQILEARETSKMAAVSEALMMNPQVRDAFAAKDRKRLLEVTAPLYVKLKAEGITNWIFHTAEPDRSVFLRLHNPTAFGDQLNRFIDQEAVRTHALVSGNELAKAGFATRILRPFYDSGGKVIGYVEFGEEIGRFIQTMKSQTGDDYGLLLDKKFVDPQLWAATNASLKRRDNWADNPNFVVADKTQASDTIIQFQGELATVPSLGEVLERFTSGDSVFVRGIFPIYNAAHDTVGAMFVVRDISGFYVSMKNTQNVLILLSGASLLLGTLLVITLLNRLIFRRLEQIIVVATRVVGGDYETEIRIGSTDEIGQFEQLFEQFRRVFIDLLSHVPEFQEKK